MGTASSSPPRSCVTRAKTPTGSRVSLGYFFFDTFGGMAPTYSRDLAIHTAVSFGRVRQALGRVTYGAIGRSGGPNGPAPSTANNVTQSVSESLSPIADPNSPMNMFPFT